HEAAAARSFGGALFFRIDYLPPGVIGVERGDTRGIPGRAFAEILFVYVAIIVDDERHDAGVAIFGGVGDEPEATDHVATHDIVDRAARCRRALAGQDLETVAVERLAGTGAITALRCIGNGFTQRARLFVAACRPIEPVLLAGCADGALRIDRLAGLVFVHVGVWVLRVPVGQNGLYGRELVAAD